MGQSSVDDDESPTVVETVTDATFHVVDDAGPVLEEKVAARGSGTTVRLGLAPVSPTTEFY